MRNERLRALLLERGKSPDQLAEHVRVDAKTVERWITRGRLPYRRHRFEVASFLGVDEAYIWPDALGRDEVAIGSESEVVAVWPHRSEVPRDTWGHLFSQAEREIGVLVYAGLFLSEDAGAMAVVWFGLAGAVAFSRVYVRMHHASDTVAGAAFGLVLGTGLRRILRPR